MEAIKKFIIPVTFSLTSAQQEQALEALNSHHVGDAKINYMIDGRYEGKYTEHTNFKALQAAHWRVASSQVWFLEVVLTPEGRLAPVRFVDAKGKTRED